MDFDVVKSRKIGDEKTVALTVHADYDRHSLLTSSIPTSFKRRRDNFDKRFNRHHRYALLLMMFCDVLNKSSFILLTLCASPDKVRASPRGISPPRCGCVKSWHSNGLVMPT